PPREERDTNRPPRSHHAKAQVSPPPRGPASNLPHFDFSKPYEPTVKPTSTAAVAEPVAGHRRQTKRPTGALLGGKRVPKTEE
ncbi:MAG: hypothetical protein ABL931_14910, partial [Usitatibacteraceae bacterium]